MVGSSTDIENLLLNVNDPEGPTPCQLPPILHDIIVRLNAQEMYYAVIDHIAFARYEQARYVKDIEIVVRSHGVSSGLAAALADKTRQRFAPYMDQRTRANAIKLSLRPCLGSVEDIYSMRLLRAHGSDLTLKLPALSTS